MTHIFQAIKPANMATAMTVKGFSSNYRYGPPTVRHSFAASASGKTEDPVAKEFDLKCTGSKTY